MAANALGTRTIAAAAMILVAVTALWLGDAAFWLLATLAALAMVHEWAGLDAGSVPSRRLAMFALSVPLAILSPFAAGPGFFALGLIAGAAFFMMIVSRRSHLAIGMIYVGIPVLAILWLREADNGLMIAFWTLAVVWATDIGAYFAGRAIGGPKLAPMVSPNKTWAGLAGGVVAALGFSLFIQHWAGLPRILVLFSPVLAMIAQAGDLYESWLKRRAGLKDSGTLLPGHGGVLDRLDGLVPVAPAVALLLAARMAG